MTASTLFREAVPPRELRSHVWSLWAHHVEASDPPYRHRAVPNGSVHFVCRIGDAAEILGPHTRPVLQLIPPGTTVIGARFHPGTALVLGGVPASELVDRVVPAEVLTGRWGEELGERLAQVTSTAEAVTSLAEQIAARFGVGSAPDPIVQSAVRQLLPGNASRVGAVAAAAGISERQLRRRFEAAVGMAPKALQRLLRFQAVLAEVQSILGSARPTAGPTLAGVAARAGYADQSHLSRDCLRFTGMSPGCLLAETALHCGTDHKHSAAFTPLFPATGR